jgi:hypothetical protein
MTSQSRSIGFILHGTQTVLCGSQKFQGQHQLSVKKHSYIYLAQTTSLLISRDGPEQQLEIKHHATSLGTIIIITRDNQWRKEVCWNDRICDELYSEQVSAQVSLLLQSRCLIPKFHFIARTLPPSDALLNFATHFDNNMFNLFTRRTRDTWAYCTTVPWHANNFRFAGRSILSLKSYRSCKWTAWSPQSNTSMRCSPVQKAHLFFPVRKHSRLSDYRRLYLKRN